MSDPANSIYNIRHLDDLARGESTLHRLHPLAKLITAVAFLAVVVSFSKYEISGLLPFFIYPVLLLSLSGVPPAPIVKRILIAEPFVIGIGIVNLLVEKQTFVLGGITLSTGWITFLSIFLKCGLTIAAALLLVATTGMDRLAAALRALKIPKLFVLQLLLTYRYISILMEEVARMLRAYTLRSPRQKGIHRSAWGSFAGQLILRTFDRAQRIYQAMCARGFTGEYPAGEYGKLKAGDYAYLAGWILFFTVARIYNIPLLIGSIVTGVIK